MASIICSWKLVKHFDCFGDNRRTKDTTKITLCGLKACCMTLNSVTVKMNRVPKRQASHARLVVHMLSRKRKPGAWRPPVNVSKFTRIPPPRNPLSRKKFHLDCVFDFQRICSLHFVLKTPEDRLI